MDTSNTTERIESHWFFGTATKAAAAAGAAIAVVLAVLGGKAISAQDKYTLQVPNGLEFSDFRGYENWEDVAVSQTENGIKVIVANLTMMAAYRDGLPADGKLFPDGSKDKDRVDREAECGVSLLRHGTGYAEIGFAADFWTPTDGPMFGYDAASETFTPHGNDPQRGYECHSRVSAQDYIFTAYSKR